MNYTKEQNQEMLKAAEPLMQWLAMHGNPHLEARVTVFDVELVEGQMRAVDPVLRPPTKEHIPVICRGCADFGMRCPKHFGGIPQCSRMV
jgi:hypothetical protein